MRRWRYLWLSQVITVTLSSVKACNWSECGNCKTAWLRVHTAYIKEAVLAVAMCLPSIHVHKQIQLLSMFSCYNSKPLQVHSCYNLKSLLFYPLLLLVTAYHDHEVLILQDWPSFFPFFAMRFLSVTNKLADHVWLFIVAKRCLFKQRNWNTLRSSLIGSLRTTCTPALLFNLFA